MFCSYEDIYNGTKYVLFDGRYNYTQAAAKCAENGANLAMAGNNDTFTFLFNLHTVYWNSGGLVNGMFLDGSNEIVNPQFSGWYCVNVPGACPATMPWQPLEPNDPQAHCVGALTWLRSGVADFSCQIQFTTMCKFPVLQQQ